MAWRTSLLTRASTLSARVGRCHSNKRGSSFTHINDILDLSKFESGKLELESIPCALRDVVDQAMDLLDAMAFGKGLEINAWIDPRIASNLVGVRQVFLNLLNNAIKFTLSGEIYLQVEPSVDINDMVHFFG